MGATRDGGLEAFPQGGSRVIARRGFHAGHHRTRARPNPDVGWPVLPEPAASGPCRHSRLTLAGCRRFRWMARGFLSIGSAGIPAEPRTADEVRKRFADLPSEGVRVPVPHAHRRSRPHGDRRLAFADPARPQISAHHALHGRAPRDVSIHRPAAIRQKTFVGRATVRRKGPGRAKEPVRRAG